MVRRGGTHGLVPALTLRVGDDILCQGYRLQKLTSCEPRKIPVTLVELTFEQTLMVLFLHENIISS